MADEREFAFEVDGPDLQFDAAETVVHLPFKPLQHLLIVAHPHESVDDDTFLSSAEGGVPKGGGAALEVEQGRLKAKEHGGIGAHQCVVYLSGGAEVVADGP